MNQLLSVFSRWMGEKPVAGASRKKGGRKATRGCRFESLEQRQLFALAPIARLGDLSTLLIPTGTSPVHFFADYRESPHNDELGYFFVDGPDGRITKRQDSDPFGTPLLSADGKP